MSTVVMTLIVAMPEPMNKNNVARIPLMTNITRSALSERYLSSVAISEMEQSANCFMLGLST